MDVVGLMLAIPAVVAANLGYVLLVRFVLSRGTMLKPWLLWPSYCVLAVFVFEVLFVTAIGSVAARTLLSPAFWGFHLLAVLFGAPALANILLLAVDGVWRRHWYATAAVCFLFGVILLLFQVGVGESLYGPDGDSRPFSWLKQFQGLEANSA